MTVSTPNKNVRDALRAARKEFGAVKKDAKNDHFKQRYPTLDSALSAVEPALEANNVDILPTSDYDSVHGKNVLVTELYHHPSGESEFCKISLPDNSDPQKVGSAITYFRRYSIMLKLNLIAEDDDDGNVASGRKPPAAAPKAAAPKPAALKPEPMPADPNDPDLGKPGYTTLLNRLQAMCEAFRQEDVLDRFVAECGVEFKAHYSDMDHPRPYLLKSFLMSHDVTFEKEKPWGVYGMTQSKVAQVNALLDSIEIGLSGEGFGEG